MFEESFLKKPMRFQKNEYLKNVSFFIIFSVSYNNVVVTKQIYFSLTFLKSWFHISDNITGVVGDWQYY